MNFPRFNKMKGMGQIVTWSARDETLHTVSAMKLFRTFVDENPEIWTEKLQQDIYKACETIIHHEDAFIDLAFEMGGVEGLDAPQVKQYIRYIADRRLVQLNLQPIYRTEKNPLPWMDEMLNGIEHTNFFEKSRHRIFESVHARHMGRGLRLSLFRLRPRNAGATGTFQQLFRPMPAIYELIAWTNRATQ